MTLTLDLPSEDEAALRELADAPPDVRSMALREALGVLRRDSRTGRITEDQGVNEQGALTALELLQATPAVREAALKQSAMLAEEYYASPEGRAEWEDMADWRALDGEDFHGFDDGEEAEKLAA